MLQFGGEIEIEIEEQMFAWGFKTRANTTTIVINRLPDEPSAVYRPAAALDCAL